jgi:hypothetical protein
MAKKIWRDIEIIAVGGLVTSGSAQEGSKTWIPD